MVANMIMAPTKTFLSLYSTPKPKLSFPKLPFPNFQIPHKLLHLPLLTTTTTTTTLLTTLFLNPPPSLAEEFEKAALFDFDLTLPIIIVEFLFLMFALDKLYYSPLGNFMDVRDTEIKEKLSSVKDTSGKVKQLEAQASAVMRAARAEISAALNKMKKETQVEVEEKVAEGRKKVEAELAEALANLEKQKDDTVKALDCQIASLSDEIVKKLLPTL